VECENYKDNLNVSTNQDRHVVVKTYVSQIVNMMFVCQGCCFAVKFLFISIDIKVIKIISSTESEKIVVFSFCVTRSFSMPSFTRH
jgi:hypothetical protein